MTLALPVALAALSRGDAVTEPPPPPPPPVATTVAVTPASATLTALGETAHLAADVRDRNGLVTAVEGAAGHYMGARSWRASGVLGTTHLGGTSSVSRLGGHTVAHEFGHNFSLDHEPCGNPAGTDPRYPRLRAGPGQTVAADAPPGLGATVRLVSRGVPDAATWWR